MIFFEGGGWCFTSQDCLDRSKTYQGISTQTNPSMDFEYILTKYSKWNHGINTMQCNFTCFDIYILFIIPILQLLTNLIF
nr:pectin acetylesterase 8-like [Ipomoea batatas]